jgi:tetratricopeptide (TPR) repeat protein
MYQDVDGNEFRRSYGPLNGDQFLAEYWLAHGLRFFHSGQFEKAVEVFEQALDYTKSDPLRHPENLYWIGPAKYEATDDVDALMAGFKRLQETYPDNDWTKKTFQLKFD